MKKKEIPIKDIQSLVYLEEKEWINIIRERGLYNQQ